MSRYEIKLSVDDDKLGDNEAIANYVRKNLGEDVNIEEILSVSNDNHTIHSQADVPCDIYFDFDGFEDLEFSHVEKQRTDHADMVINTPLNDGMLYCTCGDLNNATEQDAIDHLKDNSPNLTITKYRNLKHSRIDDQSVIRRGETASGRRSEEVIHRNPSTEESLTFVSVSKHSDIDPIDKSLDYVMNDEEWGNADIVYEEDDEICVVRLSRNRAGTEQMDVDEETSFQLTEEHGHHNSSRSENVQFVSVYSFSPDTAVERAADATRGGGSWDDVEVVYKENNVYVVRLSNHLDWGNV